MGEPCLPVFVNKCLLMKKWFTLFLLMIGFVGFAQIEDALPKKPVPASLVYDETGMLSSMQQDDLKQKLEDFDKRTTNQIAVVIVNSTKGFEPGDFATELGRKWNLGNKENQNGVVLLVVKDTRKFFIAVGSGLQGNIPDITAKHIIDEQIRPNFKAQDFYGGLNAGTNALMEAAEGKYKAPPGYRDRNNSRGGSILPFIIMLVILIIIFSNRKGGGGGMMSRRGYRSWNNSPGFFPIFIGGGGGGFDGGGSSSGGGFDFGGGGGGFDGGGAGGDW
jgi:uncharacterized protein